MTIDATPLAGDPKLVATDPETGVETWEGSAVYVDTNYPDDAPIQRTFTGTSAGDWANQMADLVPEIEAQLAARDSEENVTDEEIAPNKRATRAQRAVAYLRRAYQSERSHEAFRMYKRFDDYRTDPARDWTLDEVQTRLMAEGLTEAEWAVMRQDFETLNQLTNPQWNILRQVEDYWHGDTRIIEE